MTFAVVVFPGSNCDEDAHHAAGVIGEQAEYIWHKDTDLKGADVVILPGGFAHGDYLRTGAMARDDVDRFLSQHLLSRLESLTAGTAEVKGTLLALDCRPRGVLRFVVTGEGAPLRLEAPSATGVFLYGRDGGQLERTFTCGPQHEAVTARYRPVPVPSPDGEDGTLISLTFESR